MFLARRALWAFLIALPLLFSGNVFADVYDDYVPDVTDRVARISVVRGDAQIRHADSQDWERVVPNLPIVEGDEIATDAGARLEIQLNTKNYIRLAENSYLKFTQLRDAGIALSVPQGTMSLRVMEFDKDNAYIEIDAPDTTLAVQKPGLYRVDAGRKDDSEIRLTVADGGEARVYSDNSGFTLRNGRSARIYIAGPSEGEWETNDASRYADEFDSWGLERDAIIAKRLRDAHYDKYYDRDMYGAEELNEYGEWVFTRRYGYVWKPYRNSVSQYSNWSPYRYGYWRWVPPYGWTWINDESWGWVTYHHGRWLYDDGFWYWSPYGQYRLRRSWWMPALVVITGWNSSICWYPLPYSYGYYNYNYYYYNNHHGNWGGGHHNGGNNGGGHNGGNNGGGTGGGNNGGGGSGGPGAITPLMSAHGRVLGPPFQFIPATGVVTVAASDFGRDKGSIKSAPVNISKDVLSRAPDTKPQTKPILPEYRDLNGKVGKEIRVDRPKNEAPVAQVKTGAAVRTNNNGPLDADLRKSRVLGDRPPLVSTPNSGKDTLIPGTTAPEVRKTGAVSRPPAGEIKQAPVYTPPIRQEPTRDDDSKGDDSTRRSEPKRESPPVRNDPPPRNDPPVRQPRYDPPPVKHDPPPRYDPPPRNDPPPRSDPPPTRHDPPPKSDPPKSDPPKNDKPSAPLESGRGKSKDGR